MDVAAIVKQVLPVAALTIPFAMGLQAPPNAALYLVREWRLGLRAFVALFVVVPTITVLGLLWADLPRPVNAALLTLSAAPMLPALHFLLRRCGTERPYEVGLDVGAALTSVVMLPVVFWVVSQLVPVVVHLDPSTILETLLKGLFLPLAAGMVVNALTRGRTEAFGATLVNVATLVFILCALLLIWAKRDVVMEELQWTTLLAIALFVAVGLATGHLLGGPHPGNRAALALVACGRHVGVALVVVKSLLPDLFLPTAAVLVMYALVRPLLVLPYARQAMARAGGGVEAEI